MPCRYQNVLIIGGQGVPSVNLPGKKFSFLDSPPCAHNLRHLGLGFSDYLCVLGFSDQDDMPWGARIARVVGKGVRNAGSFAQGSVHRGRAGARWRRPIGRRARRGLEGVELVLRRQHRGTPLQKHNSRSQN